MLHLISLKKPYLCRLQPWVWLWHKEVEVEVATWVGQVWKLPKRGSPGGASTPPHPLWLQASHFGFLFGFVCSATLHLRLVYRLKPTYCIFKDVNQPTKGGRPTMTTAISSLRNIYLGGEGVSWQTLLIVSCATSCSWENASPKAHKKQKARSFAPRLIAENRDFMCALENGRTQYGCSSVSFGPEKQKVRRFPRVWGTMYVDDGRWWYTTLKNEHVLQRIALPTFQRAETLWHGF